MQEDEELVQFLPISEDAPGLSVIAWEDFQNSLSDVYGAASAASELRAQRNTLAEKLEFTLKIRKQSLQRIDELEAMKKRLKFKELMLENAKVALQERSEDIAIAKDKLLPSARSLLVAANTLVAAHNRLQDACTWLEGGGGQSRLSHLRNMLNARRRLMISQIAALYPIAQSPAVPSDKSHVPPMLAEEKHLTTSIIPQSSASPTKESQSLDKADTLPMTIGGLHVVAPLNMKPGIYSEPGDHEASSTALGYVAHALALLAACLDVPLRYLIRLGASRSYIQDHAPVVDSNEAVMNGAGPNPGAREFPLFSEGQDSTRSAYAVFLLNKDLEQVLNYLGAESVGPRHTLPNLNKIIQLVCSGACTTA